MAAGLSYYFPLLPPPSQSQNDQSPSSSQLYPLSSLYFINKDLFSFLYHFLWEKIEVKFDESLVFGQVGKLDLLISNQVRNLFNNPKPKVMLFYQLQEEDQEDQDQNQEDLSANLKQVIQISNNFQKSQISQISHFLLFFSLCVGIFGDFKNFY